MKEFILNRKHQKIAVLVEFPKKVENLVFIMHGLSGYKEQSQLEMFAKTFLEKNFISVRFDTTNTFGESDGSYDDATTTNYYEDLEDVISWAKKQNWYIEPFALAGHSLGGICTILYAQKNPHEIKALFPASTVISGKLSFEIKDKEALEEWKRIGWQFKQNSEGKSGKLKWNHMEDRLKYDVLLEAKKLTMPVLIVVGSEDESTPFKHQKILYDLLPGKKEIHVIDGSKHTFKEEKHISQIKEILSGWIDKISN